MVDRVSGRTVLVTGAGQGMGAGIARALAAEGANVAVGDINVAAADAVAAALRDEGHPAISVGMDVTKRDDVRAAIAGTVREFGRLDVMFNNAGLNKPMQFLDVTEDNWNLVMDVNALGVLIGTQEAAKQMIAQGGGGKIVNTASIASRQGYAEFVPYCASKFAVVAIIQAGARALAGDQHHGERLLPWRGGDAAVGPAGQGHGRHPRRREGGRCLRRLRLGGTAGPRRTGGGHRPDRGVPRQRGQ